jgi:iron complex outermembrane receptor protein
VASARVAAIWIGVAGGLLGPAPVARAEPDLERTTPPVLVEGARPEPLPQDPTSFTHAIEVDEHAGEHDRVEDLLESVPGVHVRRFGGPGAPAEISIRGSSASQVVVLLDGVRLNSPQTGGVDVSTVPLALLERIEVSRGGGSVQAGSDAIGGVVNLVTRRASARPETRIAGAAGSFETWQGSLSQTGRLLGFEGVVGYDVFKTSGDWDFETLRGPIPDDTDSAERINNRSEHHAALVKLARDLGDSARVEVSDQLFHGSDGRPGPDRASGGALRGQSPVGHQRRTRNVAQLHLQAADVSPAQVDAELRAFHRFDRSRFRDDSFSPEVDTDDRNSSYGGRADLAKQLAWRGISQVPSAGIELRRDELDPLGAGYRARRVLGVFLQHEVALLEGRARLVPALRFDETQGFGSEWIPRVGLVLAPLPWLELRANAERAYRVPNFDELYFDEGSVRGNPDLRSEDSVDFDAGLRAAGAWTGWLRSASLEAAFFASEIDDTIVFQNINDTVLATNVSDARTRGVELGGRVELAGGVGVSGSWTHLDSEVRRSDSPLPGRPEDECDGRIALRPFGGPLELVGEVHYTGEIPANEGGQRFLNQRTTFDASLGVELDGVFRLGERTGLSGLLASVAAHNVTDRAVRDAQLYPQPGRTLTFGLEGRW